MSDASLPTNHDIGFDVSPGTTYPSTFSTPIEFANPDSMLSGTLRGTQFVGSNTLQIDSTQNLITIKNSAAALNQTGVLRVGTVAQNYLGMAVNNGTVDTMFAGQDSTGATVIKIAKTGYDAKTATNDQLIFNSSQNVFKITKTVDLTLILGPTATAVNSFTTSVPHGLSYTPAFMSFLTIDPNLMSLGGVSGVGTQYASYWALPVSSSTNLIRDGIRLQVYVDNTNFYFMGYSALILGSAYVNTAHIYVMQETFS